MLTNRKGGVDFCKAKVEVWCLVMFVIIGSFFFLYNNTLPVPSPNIERLGSGSTERLKLDLKECEEKATNTKLYLADSLAELSELREKAGQLDIRSARGNEGKEKENKRIFLLEDELRRLKKANSHLRVASIDAVDSNGAVLDSNTVLRRTLEVSNYLPTYDPETIGNNPSYDTSKEVHCYGQDCSPEILNNRAAYTDCGLTLATTWNAIGVKNMERYVSLGKNFSRPSLTIEHARYLSLAREAFSNATQTDPSCWRAHVNLAFVHMQYNDANNALKSMNEAINLEKSAQNWAILGFIQDFAEDRSSAMTSWANALKLDPLIGERKYFGIMVVDDTVPERHIQTDRIREYDRRFEVPMARDVLTYIEFSPVSISNYPILPPGTQEFFVSNQYIILRDIIPPFILRSVAECFKQLRENGKLHLGDHQSKRYSSYNSRAGRTLHYQLVDLMRRVVVHNLIPTYSFFGGYIGGAKLPPHSDKPQCEFTVSLTLQQFPEEVEPWPVSLGAKPTFSRDDTWEGRPDEEMPPDGEIVDAYLYPGDCLLFMGRHLVHFRRTELPEGEGLDQVFFHHVREDFTGIYDI